ncbi:MAG: DUF5011 domain-containing protein [Acholeplasmataceae bacterium]|nr:DUF5011 domain-containing protein [Acholeplasmataceae bacterium]
MRKLFFIITFFLVIMLSSCQEPSAEFIVMKLNPGIDTIELGLSYIDPGATARYGFKNLNVEVISNTVNTEVLGTYEIIYQAIHNDFSKTMKRIITVIDQTPPLIILNPGIDTIYTDETWIDEGVSVFDASGENITILVTGTVLSTPGEYIITYQATDESGNSSFKIRYVNVIAR